MDIKLKQKKYWIPKKYWLWAGGGALIIVLLIWLATMNFTSTLRVDRRGLSIGKVSKAQFDDYVSVDGSVVPIQVVQISSEEGGVVLEKVKEEGTHVRSTIDGEIGLLDVELGQSISPGQKIGVINDLSDYKVEAQVDEHYIDRVHAGLSATFEQNGKTYRLTVRKVYPEVREGRFKIDFTFSGSRPKNIRTGQTYYVDLQLGESKKAIIIPKGTFYSVTGGSWIFVLDKDGRKAYRRKMRIGRQNPQYYEVLEGLEPGEQVIVSGYEGYKNNEILVLE